MVSTASISALIAATASLWAVHAPVVVATAAPAPVFDYSKTEAQRMSQFNSSDYVLDLLHPSAANAAEIGDGGSITRMNLATLPALARQGVAMTLIQLEPCGTNLPHIHPRAAEAIYVIETEEDGNGVQIGFIEENSGKPTSGKVNLNTMSTGQGTFVPQGAIHFEVNLDCSPATLIAFNNNEDPGTLSIPARFFQLPSGEVAAALGGAWANQAEFDLINSHIQDLHNPAPGVYECLQRCGLIASANSTSATETSAETLATPSTTALVASSSVAASVVSSTVSSASVASSTVSASVVASTVSSASVAAPATTSTASGGSEKKVKNKSKNKKNKGSKNKKN